MSAKLQALLDRKNALNDQIRAEQAKEQSRQRKLETRRKVLVGSLVRDMMEKDAQLKADIMRRLESFLTRRIDRELFELPVEGVGSEQAESAA